MGHSNLASRQIIHIYNGTTYFATIASRLYICSNTTTADAVDWNYSLDLQQFGLLFFTLSRSECMTSRLTARR
jgi:hypothetical protein